MYIISKHPPEQAHMEMYFDLLNVFTYIEVFLYSYILIIANN